MNIKLNGWFITTIRQERGIVLSIIYIFFFWEECKCFGAEVLLIRWKFKQIRTARTTKNDKKRWTSELDGLKLKAKYWRGHGVHERSLIYCWACYTENFKHYELLHERFLEYYASNFQYNMPSRIIFNCPSFNHTVSS